MSNKKQYLQNCRYCKKSRQPNFQKKPLNKIWAPPRLKFPELSGIPSSHRVYPVPKNLLFSEDGPDGYLLSASSKYAPNSEESASTSPPIWESFAFI